MAWPVNGPTGPCRDGTTRTHRPITFDAAVEEAESLIVESTRLRLISDVPIAALLSGGVDSTLVCWALSRLNANLTAFTVGTPGDPSDEAGQARQTAQKLGIPHEVVELPADRPEMLTEMEDAYSEPSPARAHRPCCGFLAR